MVVEEIPIQLCFLEDFTARSHAKQSGRLLVGEHIRIATDESIQLLRGGVVVSRAAKHRLSGTDASKAQVLSAMRTGTPWDFRLATGPGSWTANSDLGLEEVDQVHIERKVCE